MRLERLPSALAFLALPRDLFFLVVGLVAKAFGIHDLLKGQPGTGGGFGPLSKRGVHAMAGIRMIGVELGSPGFGAYLP